MDTLKPPETPWNPPMQPLGIHRLHIKNWIKHIVKPYCIMNDSLLKDRLYWHALSILQSKNRLPLLKIAEPWSIFLEILCKNLALILTWMLTSNILASLLLTYLILHLWRSSEEFCVSSHFKKLSESFASVNIKAVWPEEQHQLHTWGFYV